MYYHTLILAAPRNNFSNSKIDIDTIVHLIRHHDTKIEYFGLEIDNQADYVDAEMQSLIERTTFIYIHIQTVDPIDYEALSETEIHELFFEALANLDNIKICPEEKDIEIIIDYHN